LSFIASGNGSGFWGGIVADVSVIAGEEILTGIVVSAVVTGPGTTAGDAEVPDRPGRITRYITAAMMRMKIPAARTFIGSDLFWLWAGRGSGGAPGDWTPETEGAIG
jgi:hypothetical protein